MYELYLQNKKTYCIKAGSTYQRPLLRLREFTKVDPKIIGLQDITNFMEYLKVELPKVSTGDWHTTYSYTITIVKDFLKFCENPVYSKIKIPRIKYNPHTPVSRVEFDMLDDYLETEPENFANMQKRLMLNFLFWTAVRVSELITINWADINLLLPELYIKNKKNDDGRWIFWPNHVHALLVKFIGQRKQYNGDSLFVTYLGRMNSRCVQRFLNNLGKKIGLPYELSPHCLRHGRAHDLFNHGADIKIVKDALGHKSFRSTERYLIMNKQERKKIMSGYLT